MSFSLSEFDSIVEKFKKLVGDEYVVSKKSAYVVEFYEGDDMNENSASVEVKYMSGFDVFVVDDFRRSEAETKFDSKARVYEYVIEEL